MGDQQLERRSLRVAEGLPNSPEYPINRAGNNAAPTKAAYRLLLMNNFLRHEYLHRTGNALLSGCAKGLRKRYSTRRISILRAVNRS